MEKDLSQLKSTDAKRLIVADQCGLSAAEIEIIAESFERAANKKRKNVFSKIFFTRTK